MITNVVSRIRSEMLSTLNEVYRWFNVDESLMNHRPTGGGWTIRQILEHISLTNHFLLILIDKGVEKSLDAARKGRRMPDLGNYDLEWDRMTPIREPGAFEWNRPEHMEPKGLVSLEAIKGALENQLRQCLNDLDRLQNGEGVLHSTMMSVNNLGRLDVYHYLYFVVQHAKRHLVQLQKVESAFEQQRDDGQGSEVSPLL